LFCSAGSFLDALSHFQGELYSLASLVTRPSDFGPAGRVHWKYILETAACQSAE
jgi:hypothetical protein